MARNRNGGNKGIVGVEDASLQNRQFVMSIGKIIDGKKESGQIRCVGNLVIGIRSGVPFVGTFPINVLVWP
jgi:hypothetical protein